MLISDINDFQVRDVNFSDLFEKLYGGRSWESGGVFSIWVLYHSTHLNCTEHSFKVSYLITFIIKKYNTKLTYLYADRYIAF